ncbi:MAG: hypothetical protein SV062_14645, partial [Thermodesulfobacteriota bacterium]|nr:hypothetical protein [Thermodesulfobacteriota bacterium]
SMVYRLRCSSTTAGLSLLFTKPEYRNELRNPNPLTNIYMPAKGNSCTIKLNLNGCMGKNIFLISFCFTILIMVLDSYS